MLGIGPAMAPLRSLLSNGQIFAGGRRTASESNARDAPHPWRAYSARLSLVVRSAEVMRPRAVRVSRSSIAPHDLVSSFLLSCREVLLPQDTGMAQRLKGRARVRFRRGREATNLRQPAMAPKRSACKLPW
jgi:hypothetical protein